MAELKDIREQISLYSTFKNIATVEKLGNAGGSKTVRRAKEVGVFLSRKAGHDEADIAETFGYTNKQSVSNVFRKAARDFQNDDHFMRVTRDLAEKLKISLE